MDNPRKILIITNSNPFSAYLAQRALEFNYRPLVLKTNDMLEQRAHCEDTSLQKKAWIPTGDGQVICHSELSGLIILTADLLAGTRQESAHLGHYIECAWVAFWLYACKQVKTVINMLHHEMLCPSYLSVPHVYQAMREVGLRTPQWRFNSDHVKAFINKQGNADRLSNQGLCSNDIHDYPRCLDIHPPKGQRVFCLYVVGQIIQEQASKTISIPDEIQRKVMKLCRVLRLDLAEVVLIKERDGWVGYHLSRQPGWDARWQPQWYATTKIILSWLNKQDNRYPPASKAAKTFIMPGDLPFAKPSQSNRPTTNR